MIEATLAGREAAESMMLDTGTAKRPTGETAYDPGEQAQVPTYVDGFEFSSPCKLQARALAAQVDRAWTALVR